MMRLGALVIGLRAGNAGAASYAQALTEKNVGNGLS